MSPIAPRRSSLQIVPSLIILTSNSTHQSNKSSTMFAPAKCPIHSGINLDLELQIIDIEFGNLSTDLISAQNRHEKMMKCDENDENWREVAENFVPNWND